MRRGDRYCLSPSRCSAFSASADIFDPVPTPAQQLGRALAGKPLARENNGFSCSVVVLGEAGGMSCGGFYGAALGAGVLYGSSIVTDSYKKSCDCGSER